MEVNIRKATAEDYNALCELFDAVDALHRAHLPHLFQKPNGPVREPAYYGGLITDESVGLFVADGGEKLVGFVHAVIQDAPATPVFVPRRYAIVDNLGVKPEFQNHGIGRMLMDTVHEWAISKGATAIELNVYEFNKTALAFYHKLGYGTLSRRMRRTLNRG
ncbi:MAG: GNAT family N-acetyltransferase [Anaerolineales bacterium]|nr:GNAT family N-acetyltransferase [Anaerolineales bacterium]